MFVKIRMLFYVLIAKPDRMQNVSDLPTHNSSTTNLDNPYIDWICNWCCLPFCNHSDQGFNAESNRIKRLRNPPLFRITSVM